MNRVKYTEWIDSYVDGELDETGRKKFEDELQTNRELALEYNLEKELRSSLSQEDLLDFRAKCIKAQNEVNIMSSKMARVVQFTRKYWYAAASLVLIALVTGWMVLFNPGGYSSEKLFKMYYKSSNAYSVSRSVNGNMVEALRYFSKNDFQNAERLFSEILSSDPSNIAVMYYSGISNIEIGNYTKAVTLFESIIHSSDNLYSENAEWYLGLAHLASGEVEQANNVFTGIASVPKHFYNKEAKSILEKIGKHEKNVKFMNNLFFLILPF